MGYTKIQRLNETSSNMTKSRLNYTANSFQSNDLRDILICTGEYSDEENSFYITVTKPGFNNNQYIIKSNETNWIVNFTTILNNSQYCVALSKKNK